MRPLTLASRVRLRFYLTLFLASLAGSLAAWLSGSAMLAMAAFLAAGLWLGAWLLQRALGPIHMSLQALRDGVKSFRDKDFSLRLAVHRRDEFGELMELYNEVADRLRDERHAIRQKEIMLETVLRATPMALILTTADDRIAYANRAAVDLFAPGERLQGHRLADVLRDCPPAMRGAFEAGTDTLFTVDQRGEEETFHVARREFQLNARQHTLSMVRRLTHELRRQEVEIWKKVIRLMSHELNNSLAPIASLSHSARAVAGRPDQAEKLSLIFDTIEERAAHLRDFLEGYARFARLPRPARDRVEWEPFVRGLERMCTFRLDAPLPATPGHFDPAQMQQALINLLKNAEESGGPPAEITLGITTAPGLGTRLEVKDRGAGMPEEVLRQALLPFYSSKPAGSGLGLPLCREIVEAHGGWLRIENREGGGVAVTCWIP
ncbi:MAG: sensor histidine kinase [Candidatus Polarisedimenticolia bacterium]